jgi:hypothetical protein
MGILAYGIVDYQPRRNIPVVLGAGLALAISVVTRWLERSQSGRAAALGPPPSWNPTTAGSKSAGAGPRRRGW